MLCEEFEEFRGGILGTPYLIVVLLCFSGIVVAMARLARVVAPDRPHHITQRGNRRMETFFCAQDYVAYRSLMATWCRHWSVEVWAYCLMPNHVHLIVVPQSEEALSHAIGEAHRRYTRRVNFREGWRGHLWQGRFSSFVMDEIHLRMAMRYVELNPVKAGLVERPGDWPWSSAAAHLTGQDDALVRIEPMYSEIGDWEAYLALDIDEEEAVAMRRHARTGRPLGNDAFILKLETALARQLHPKKRGPKGPRKTN